MPIPPSIQHPAFGTLAFAADVESFETDMSDGVRLSVWAGNGVPSSRALLDRIAAERDALASGAADHATAELFEPSMDGWLDEGETEITPEIFRRRLTLMGIVVREDEVDFTFTDGNLFWGHLVTVTMDITGTYSRAHISG